MFVRNRRPSYRLIRQTLRSQLQFIRRNIGHIQTLSKSRSLTAKQETKLSIIQQVYEQQLKMYEERSHQHADRIVSVSQPDVRPIVRGKAATKTEFGAKIAVSLENGYARIEKLSWDAFNESQTLQSSCERYFERHGYYPERILADKIYRTRDNLNYCSRRGITMNGPKLGRPPKDRALYDEQKRRERLDAGERNAIEGKFGEAKRRYGLNRVMTRKSTSSETTIAMIFLLMNLKKTLRDLFCAFFLQIYKKLHFEAFLQLAFGQ